MKKTARVFIPFFLLAFFLCIIPGANATIISYKKQPGSVVFKLDKGLMKIVICKADIIEVKYTISDKFGDKPSLVVNKKWNYPAFSITPNKDGYTITTSRLKMLVSKATEALRYTDLNGDEILSEAQTGNKTIMPATIAGINTYNVSTEYNSPAGEGLYGLGCHPRDTLSINYKGRNQDLAIRYMTGAIPVLLSTRGYGLMWDNYSASNFYGAEDNNTKFKYVS
ncbi:MAG: hypothetical protein ACXVJB_05585, partial [Mucilaginibacter sp.]